MSAFVCGLLLGGTLGVVAVCVVAIGKLMWLLAIIACPFAVLAMPREEGDAE